MKLTSTILGVAVAAALAGIGYAAHPSHDADIQEFQAFAGEYQQAMNTYNVEAVIPRLANKLDLWMPLGIQIKTPDEFRNYMKAMGNKIGINNGGTYRIADKPKASIRYYKGGNNDEVYSAGTMSEEVQVAGQTPKSYTSHWLLHMKKQQGKWVVVGGSVEADPDHQTFTAADVSSWKAEIETAMKSTGKAKGGK